MKRRLLLFGIMLMTGFIAMARPVYATSAAGEALGGGLGIEKRAATVSIEPSLSASRDTVNVRIAYSAEQWAWKVGGRETTVAGARIQAVELLLNESSREVRTIAPSAGGEVTMTIPVAALSEAVRTHELKLQAKVYRYFIRPVAHLAPFVNRPVAVSEVVRFWIDPITWGSSSMTATGLAGTTVGVVAEFRSKAAIPEGRLRFVPTWANLAGEPAAGFAIETDRAYSIPLMLTLPASQRAGVYQGALELRAGGSLVSRVPLSITVVTATSTVVPQGMNAASDDRLVSNEFGRLVKDEIMVGLSEPVSTGDERIKAIAAQTGGGITGSVAGANFYTLRFNVPNLSALEVARKRVEAWPGVTFAAQNYLNYLHAQPNDTEYPAGAWDDGVTEDKTWALKYIHAPEAWDLTTGSRAVRMGVIDNGFAPTHEDMIGNMGLSLGSKSSIGNDYHGSGVAGVMCASGNNGRGIAGVNWQCALNTYQVSRPIASLVVQEMMRAADSGMRIVNTSMGWEPPRLSCYIDYQLPAGFDAELKKQQATYRFALNYAKNKHEDVLWVFSAGNKCNDVRQTAPGSLVTEFPDNMMVVAAVSQDRELTPGTNFGNLVTVAAPGQQVYTTQCWPVRDNCGSVPHYSMQAGTSFAAPMVAGTAGLVAAKHRDFTAGQIKECIVNGANTPVPGHGFRVIDAAEAIWCQPVSPVPCSFRSSYLPECQSTDPTVTMNATFPNDSSGCSFAIHINWGDGKAQDYTLQGRTSPGVVPYATHTYGKRGSYVIRATGQVTAGSCTVTDATRTFVLRPVPHP